VPKKDEDQKMKTNRILLLAMLLGALLAREAQAFYNPSNGRWLSRDPIEEKGGVNLYRFVSNDPLERFDALGLEDSSEPPGPSAGISGPCAEFEAWYQGEKKDTSWMKERRIALAQLKWPGAAAGKGMEKAGWCQNTQRIWKVFLQIAMLARPLTQH
jgi:hypothetical protein